MLFGMFGIHWKTNNYQYPFQQGKVMDSLWLSIPFLSPGKSDGINRSSHQKPFIVDETPAPFPVRQMARNAGKNPRLHAGRFPAPTQAVAADGILPVLRAEEIPPASGKEISR
jgi:hypothetical protein